MDVYWDGDDRWYRAEVRRRKRLPGGSANPWQPGGALVHELYYPMDRELHWHDLAQVRPCHLPPLQPLHPLPSLPSLQPPATTAPLAPPAPLVPPHPSRPPHPPPPPQNNRDGNRWRPRGWRPIEQGNAWAASGGGAAGGGAAGSGAAAAEEPATPAPRPAARGTKREAGGGPAGSEAEESETEEEIHLFNSATVLVARLTRAMAAAPLCEAPLSAALAYSLTCLLAAYSLTCMLACFTSSAMYTRTQATIGAALAALAGSRMTLGLLRATGAGKVVNRAAKQLAKCNLTISFAGDMTCRAHALVQRWKVVEQRARLRRLSPSKELEKRRAMALEGHGGLYSVDSATAARAKRARLESGPPAAGHTAGHTADDAADDGENAPLSARAAALRPAVDGGGGAGPRDRSRDRTPVSMPKRFAQLPNPAAIRSADQRAAIRQQQAAARSVSSRGKPSDSRAAEEVRCRAFASADEADAHRAVLGGLDAHLAQVRQMRERGSPSPYAQEADTLHAASRQADAMRQMREVVPAAPVVRCCPLGHALVESIRAGLDELEGDESTRVAAFLRCDTCDEP